MTIRLLIADDHSMVRKGLGVFLSTQPDIELVGEAANGLETLNQASALLPDIILMDLNMPILNGIETTKRLKESHPNINIIVLTSFSDQDHVLPAIRAGAKGYLLKDIEPVELVNAIRRVKQGQVELHPEAAGLIMNVLVSTQEKFDASEGNVSNSKGVSSIAINPLQELTPREIEVLKILTRGMSNKEIGIELNISEKTVKTHVSHLLDKLNLVDRTQAAIYAVKNGLGE